MSSDSSLAFSHYGVSSAVLNNTLFVFAKKGNRQTFNMDNNQAIENKIWSAKAKDIVYSRDVSAFVQFNHVNYDSTIQNEPYFFHSPTVSLDQSNKVIIFTKNLNVTNINNTSPTQNSATLIPQPFVLLQFSPSSEYNATIAPVIPKPSSLVPIYRQEASLSLSLPGKQHVYLLGGLNEASAQNDFWMYSIQNFEWTKLPTPQTFRCGHTASMLSDGRMVVIGGYHCFDRKLYENDYGMAKNASLGLIDMSIIDVFSTNTSIWQQQDKVKGTIPSPRAFHSAIVSNKQENIFICGGQNEKMSPFQSYIGSNSSERHQMAAILDTNRWTWRLPASSPYQPYPQSHGIISIINSTKIVYGLGENYYTSYNTLHVFNQDLESWELSPNVTSSNENSGRQLDANGSSSVKWIIVSCVLSGVLLAYIIGVCVIGFYKFNLKILHMFEGVKRRFWKPRIGEPKWAEATRLLLKTFFLSFFAYIVYVFVKQIVDSPAIDQVFYLSNEQNTVNVPDIKFCFEDWKQKDPPFIRCSTDFGAACSNYLHPLPAQINKDGAQLNCTVFQSPVDFQLGRPAFKSNGTFLKFDYYYAGQNDNSQGSQMHRLQLSFNNRLARKELPSNLPAHNLNTQVMNTVSYELVRHEHLRNSTWNYVGIAPSLSTRYYVETLVQSETHPFVYLSSLLQKQPFGSLHVLPNHYQTKVIHEQKSFALINAIGILGGLCGLLFSLQTCLFGYRPRSPWGYMHRWSFGHLRSSLMDGLHTNFHTATSSKRKSTLSLLALARNSHSGQDSLFFSENQQLPSSTTNLTDLRMSMVEEKVHVLERLFQAYYIDDEVFRSLDQALRQADESSSLPLVPPIDGPVPEKRRRKYDRT